MNIPVDLVIQAYMALLEWTQEHGEATEYTWQRKAMDKLAQLLLKGQAPDRLVYEFGSACPMANPTIRHLWAKAGAGLVEKELVSAMNAWVEEQDDV